MKLNSILKAFTYLFALLFIFSCKTETPKDGSIDVLAPMNDTIQLLDSLIKADVRNSDLYFDRALYYKSRGVYPKAIADIYSALHIDSANVDYYLFAGELFLDMNEGVKAAGLMSKGINMNPENEELYIKAIEYNYYLQNYEASLNFANDLIQINKYNADAYFLKGMIVKEIGQEDKAISTFQTCIEVDPSFYNAHMQLGLIYSYNSDDLAVQYFENALSIDDNSREAMYAIAYHYQLKDDFIPAVKKYKEMILRDAKDHEIFFNIGHCYIGLDSLDKAYKHFDLAIQIQPQYAGAYYMKGNLSEIRGNNADALTNYKQALLMLPDDTTIMNAIERVQ
ncbi:MAG: tetratricopeptide (TPR) repeat protein [Chitinophagales bacterium]|jgi:tetratricopeptide (TPR) repeat protein